MPYGIRAKGLSVATLVKCAVVALAGRSLRSRAYLFSLLCAYCRGLWYKLYFELTNWRVDIGFPFAAYGSLQISGPGTVKIGRHCFVVTNVFEGLSIITEQPGSTVVIGDGCLLGGLTIRCRKQVEIGPRLMTARSLIQDSLFVNFDAVRSKVRGVHALESSGIVLGTNVWLGGECIILDECKIGDDSVVSAGACCSGVSAGEYSLVGGSPARRPLSIEKLLRMKGQA